MVKLNKIYTKTGDDGTTGLADGSRRLKNDLRVAAYGDVDEANSFIGLLLNGLTNAEVVEQSTGGQSAGAVTRDNMVTVLTAAQHDMFDLGADLAKPLTLVPIAPSHDLRIVEKQVQSLELVIDTWNDALPALESFILPGGGYLAAVAHLARTVTRRAERSAVALQDMEEVNPLAIQYLNRLSDLLFVLSRILARDPRFGGKGEVMWKPGKNR
ncbi:MAG: cob(I)yrinic acid a,c-diamide adenosyltransferase [Hydrotalea sp.]|nr:cob(I)yrinic acid a,c-diamide adenosyltransferase [Hydrotalea sp.]